MPKKRKVSIDPDISYKGIVQAEAFGITIKLVVIKKVANQKKMDLFDSVMADDTEDNEF